MNDVLGEVSVGVLGDLDRLSHWTNMVAAVGGGRVFNFSLRAACAQAWSAAERLYALDDEQQREYVAELDELVSVLAYLITRPPIPVAVFAFFAAFPRTARSEAGHRGSARHAVKREELQVPQNVR